MKVSFYPRTVAASVLAAAVLWAASYFTIRNLGPMVGSIDDTLGAIFGSLQSAVIRPSALALFLTGVLFLLLQMLSGGKKWIFALSPLFFIAGYIGATLFASINGVLLSDMLRIVIGLAQNGLFDLL